MKHSASCFPYFLLLFLIALLLSIIFPGPQATHSYTATYCGDYTCIEVSNMIMENQPIECPAEYEKKTMIAYPVLISISNIYELEPGSCVIKSLEEPPR